jgi:hypothetical protein
VTHPTGLGQCIAEMVAAQLFNQENWEAFDELISKVGQELRKGTEY